MHLVIHGVSDLTRSCPEQAPFGGELALDERYLELFLSVAFPSRDGRTEEPDDSATLLVEEVAECGGYIETPRSKKKVATRPSPSIMPN